MALTSRYIDPTTHSYVVGDDGQYKRIPAYLGRAHNLIMVQDGTIPDAPWYKSRLRSITLMRAGVTRDVERAIDEVLAPQVGKTIPAYTRRAWIDEGGHLMHEMAVGTDADEEPAEIPLQR